MDNWVNIKARRPDKGQMVLIYEPSPSGELYEGTMFVSHWEKTDGLSDRKWAFPDFQDEQPSYYYPTHWMPLPPKPL